MERLPKLKLVATHTGGVFPYLRGRIEVAYHAYPETRVNTPKPPSEYLKRIWLDTVCYDADVLASSYAFAGPDKMVMGSDYPHQIGDLEHCVGRVKAMKIGDAESASRRRQAYSEPPNHSQHPVGFHLASLLRPLQGGRASETLIRFENREWII